MNIFTKQIPSMLTDQELVAALTVLPEYQDKLISKSERLVALMDVYKIYIPTKHSVEIYNRLYLSLVSSLEKKNTISEVRLLNNNYLMMKGFKRYGVIGGLDSFKVTGNPGVGKTSAIQRCIEIITHNKIIKTKKPYREIIPILEVETVSDCSIKNLLYSILIKIDEKLGTTFYESNNSLQTTTDTLLSAVANVLSNHVALLCIDEIERVVENKRGITLLNYLTQLINQSNISICFIGTEPSNQFFEMKEYLARRTLGISLKRMEFDEHFYSFCKVLFSYQYTLNKVEFSSGFAHWLYDHSGGLPSMLVSLFVEAQRQAILNGQEKLDMGIFEEVFKSNFSNMLSFIDVQVLRRSNVLKEDSVSLVTPVPNNGPQIFKKVSQIAYKDTEKAIQLLKDWVAVEFI